METKRNLEGNRFEALYQRWLNRRRGPRRWWRRLVTLFFAAVVLEILALAVTFGWYWHQGNKLERYLDQFLLTRYVVSPFVFENPVNKFTKAEYLGPFTNSCSAARWTVPDPLLGWRMAPAVGMLKQPYQVDNVVSWRFTNSQGFASAGDYDFFYVRPKPNGTFRVIVTGASSVEGDGAEQPKENLVAHIRARLEAEIARVPGWQGRLEVINAGVAGYQSSQEYLYLISDLASYQPDLVISYSGAVDIIRAWNTYDADGTAMDPVRTFRHDQYTQYLRESFSVLSPLIMFATNLRRQVGCFVDSLGIAYLSARILDRVESVARRALNVERKALESRTADPDYSIPVGAALKAYQNSMRLMTKAAEIYGFRIALFLQPAMTTDNKQLTPPERSIASSLSDKEIRLRSEYFSAARELLLRLKGEMASDARVCFGDLSRSFEQVQERVWDDSRHLIGAGNRIIADLLVAQLRACGQLANSR